MRRRAKARVRRVTTFAELTAAADEALRAKDAVIATLSEMVEVYRATTFSEADSVQAFLDGYLQAQRDAGVTLPTPEATEILRRPFWNRLKATP